MKENFIYCPYCRKRLDVIMFEGKNKMHLRCKDCKILYPFEWTKATPNLKSKSVHNTSKEGDK